MIYYINVLGKLLSISDEEPNCWYDSHLYEYFCRNGETSDFDELCIMCGLIKINAEGFYSNNGSEKYFRDNKFKQLIEGSREIKKKNLEALINKN